ncbi:uncharacterized protein LOC131332237 isoform X2 [Rhododendron vialii]|uniref:uncharacterized protein LOC131332237 isoform X2 n=1 Tax=Rhododendron vialii TaxID=182163 RepID=UPI00265FF0E5|nr:uncharacterized protein LOC131332237 isoform X2 [Rhododendron vialii]
MGLLFKKKPAVLDCIQNLKWRRLRNHWVLGLLVEVMGEDFKEEYINHVLQVMTSIFQLAVNVLKNRQLGLSVEATDCSWTETYYSLVLLEKILHQFHGLCLPGHLEDMWETICELLVHPHVWLRGVLNRLVAFYFASVTQANRATKRSH